MIATLTGTVAEKLGELVVLEVQNVGYGLYMTTEDHGRLQVGDVAKVYIYEHIRENAHDFYAFSELDNKQLFEQLLEVNGVGPRMALNILSIGTAHEVRQAIAHGDTNYIQTAAGVGKRVAERVVVELKDKVGLAADDITGAAILQAKDILLKDEAVEALVSLGYAPHDAVKALQGVDAALPPEDRIKEALKSKV